MPLAITEDHRALAEVAAAMVAGRAGTAGARRILLDRDKEQAAGGLPTDSGKRWSRPGGLACTSTNAVRRSGLRTA